MLLHRRVLRSGEERDQTHTDGSDDYQLDMCLKLSYNLSKPRFSASQAFFFFALMLATLHPLKDRSMSLAASGRSSVSIGPQPEVKCSILTFMRIVVFEKWLSGAAAINDSALL